MLTASLVIGYSTTEAAEEKPETAYTSPKGTFKIESGPAFSTISRRMKNGFMSKFTMATK